MEVAIGTDPKVGKLREDEYGQLEVVESSKLILCKGTTYGDLVLVDRPDLENLTTTEFSDIVKEKMKELDILIPGDLSKQVDCAARLDIPEGFEIDDNTFGVTRTLISLFNDHNEEMMGGSASTA